MTAVAELAASITRDTARTIGPFAVMICTPVAIVRSYLLDAPAARLFHQK